MQTKKRKAVTAGDKINFRIRLNAIEYYIPDDYREQIQDIDPTVTNSMAYNTRDGKQYNFKVLGYLEDLAEKEKARRTQHFNS